MGIREDLEEAIDAGNADREREPLEREKFWNGWLAAREDVLATFREAAPVFEERFGHADCDRSNGAIYLQVTKRGGGRYTLTLKPDKTRKEIEVILTDSLPKAPPPYRPLDALTDNAVHDLLVEFAYLVARAEPGGGDIIIPGSYGHRRKS